MPEVAVSVLEGEMMNGATDADEDAEVTRAIVSRGDEDGTSDVESTGDLTGGEVVGTVELGVDAIEVGEGSVVDEEGMLLVELEVGVEMGEDVVDGMVDVGEEVVEDEVIEVLVVEGIEDVGEEVLVELEVELEVEDEVELEVEDEVELEVEEEVELEVEEEVEVEVIVDDVVEVVVDEVDDVVGGHDELKSVWIGTGGNVVVTLYVPRPTIV